MTLRRASRAPARDRSVRRRAAGRARRECCGCRRAGFRQRPTERARSARKARCRRDARCSPPSQTAPNARPRIWNRAPSPPAEFWHAPLRRPDRRSRARWPAHGSRGVGSRSLALPPFERKDLGGVEQPIWIEHALHPHLLRNVGGGELHAHQLALLDADAMLSGEAAAELDAKLEDLSAAHLCALKLGTVVGVVKDQRMQIAVAGMEDVDHAEAVAADGLSNLGQGL